MVNRALRLYIVTVECSHRAHRAFPVLVCGVGLGHQCPARPSRPAMGPSPAAHSSPRSGRIRSNPANPPVCEGLNEDDIMEDLANEANCDLLDKEVDPANAILDMGEGQQDVEGEKCE